MVCGSKTLSFTTYRFGKQLRFDDGEGSNFLLELFWKIEQPARLLVPCEKLFAMENGQYVDGSIWFYAPNKGAPVFFAVAFLASGACHLWQTM